MWEGKGVVPEDSGGYADGWTGVSTTGKVGRGEY